MITMLSYVLFSYSTFDFRFTLSVFCTRSRFSTHTARLLHSFSPASQLTLPLTSLCLFPSYRTRVPKRPWPGSRRPFPRNYSLERTDDTLMYPTIPRLSRHCLWIGRYFRPFVHDTTYMI